MTVLSSASSATPHLRKEAAPAPGRVSAETVDDQIAWFLDHYSLGFHTPFWERDVRGEGAEKRLKRHRDSAIAEAQELLAAERLRVHLSLGDHVSVIAALLKVLGGTSLVQVGKVRKLKELDRDAQAKLARAVVEHLRPGGDEGFGELVGAIAPLFPTMRTSWSLVTAIRALVYPKRHVCVVPGKFALQARVLGRELPAAQRPSERDYQRYRSIALDVEARLHAGGLEPRDLLDVLDFMRTTLAPRARIGLAGAAMRRRERLAAGDVWRQIA